LTPEVITLFIFDILFFIFGTIAFIIALRVHFLYDKNSTTTQQYVLEKQSYLGATIIKYLFSIKIPLFIFFIFSLEKISIILPGAMCATGVVNATEYGLYLLPLKVLNLYLFAIWIVLHSQDMKLERQVYVKIKFQFYIVLYILVSVEAVLQALLFLSIDIKDVVDCCGVVFSSSDNSYMATIIGSPPLLQAIVFYSLFLLLVLAYLKKYRRLFSVLNLLYAVVSLVTLIGFFGTYIYEMPTHHCPFCFLQYEYHYIGYVLYSFLFLGTFYGLVLGVITFTKKEQQFYYRLSLLFNSLYLVIVSLYVLLYYIKNSVWL